MIKVTDPQKVVTDPVLLSHLAKQDIHWEGVELFQDYASRSLGKEHSPYAKFYHDLNSNKRFMVVSGLPMVDEHGVKIECGWRVAGINYFSEKNNLFRAKVQGTDVELDIRNDQPDGRKANDRLSYKPQLFLDGIEQTCGQPILLLVDPINDNYLENTLQWHYGICKRRLRIIEGSIHGSWVFPANPNGEVRIKYNQTGDYRLRLGQFKISNDEEVIPQAIFDDPKTIYPFTVSDSATYYPDANPETTSVDGWVSHYLAAGLTWANLVASAGNEYGDSATSGYITGYGFNPDTNYTRLRRGIALFDSSGLPDTAVISAAILSLNSNYKYSPGDYFDVQIYPSSPASNTGLANTDYALLGSTAFSTAITYNNWSTAGYNNFTLNASGLAAISKTGVSKFGMRMTKDATVTPPNQFAEYDEVLIRAYMSEQGNGYKPKLVVTYTVPGWAHIAKVKGVTTAAIAKINGVAVLAIAKVNGVAV